MWVSALVTLVTIPARVRLRLRADAQPHALQGAVARTITLVPLLAPSLLAAISLIYWFGNQGVLKAWLVRLGIEQIYGAPGIVVAEVFSTFPHALMILITALAARRRAPVRGRRRDGHHRRGASSSPSRCRARSTA